VGVGWEKSVSAEPVQIGKGANLLLPGHDPTRSVKAMWPQASWLAYSAMALGGVNLPLGLLFAALQGLRIYPTGP